LRKTTRLKQLIAASTFRKEVKEQTAGDMTKSFSS